MATTVAHGQGVYGETNGILLMLSAPGLGVEAARVRSRVTIMGVPPTRLELVGSSVPANRDGLSFAPLSRRGTEAATRAQEDLEQTLRE